MTTTPKTLIETLTQIADSPALRREIARRAELDEDTVRAALWRVGEPSNRTLQRLSATLSTPVESLQKAIVELPKRPTRRQVHRVSGGQAALAQRMGVHQPVVHRWLSGQAIPRPETLQRLAQELGKDPDVLLVEIYQRRRARAGKDSENSATSIDV